MTDPKPLMLARSKDESEAEAQARATVSPDVGATIALAALNGRARCYGETDPTALRAELERVTADDKATGTDRLLTQAIVLDRVFSYMVTLAMQKEYVAGMALPLNLAMRAQAQCRATLTAVSDIRHPRQYVGTQHVGEQYNSGGGHQQVNRDGRAGTGENPPTGLSPAPDDGAEHELHPDGPAPARVGRESAATPTLDVLDGTDDGRGQGGVVHESVSRRRAADVA